MKVLITGIAGFAGSWLAEKYLSEEHEVHGTTRQRTDIANLSGVAHNITLHPCDIRDAHSLNRVIGEEDFDVIHHLAAISYVTYSFQNPAETIETNVIGTLNLLEAVRNAAADTVVHLAGSSEEYGLVKEDELPIKETNPLRPRSPYGVSKVATDFLGQQYHGSYGIKTVVLRAFNHEGPRRYELFATSKIAKQILEIKAGKREKLSFGLLTPKRDCTHVFDMVRAYMLAVEKCKYGEPYNICTGIAYSIGEIINIAAEIAGVKNPESELDKAQIRPTDVPVLLGDSTKFREATGWKPRYMIDDIMRDSMEWWQKVKGLGLQHERI